MRLIYGFGRFNSSAGIEANRQGIPESEWRDYLLIDGKVVYPHQRPSEIQILAGPTWEDNSAVAIIEKGVMTGALKATVVTADGRVTSMLLPSGGVNQNSLQYHQGKLLLSLNDELVALDPSGNALRSAFSDELAADSVRKQKLGIHKQLDLTAQHIAEKNGGHNGIVWSPSVVQ